MSRIRNNSHIFINELTLLKLLFNSHFVTDLQFSKLLIESNLVFVNGLNTNNSFGGINKNYTSHPWKCTANGDATIYVGEGRVHSYLDGDDPGHNASASMAGFGDWAGGNVTVTAATGVIYGELPAINSVSPLVDIIADSAGESGDVNIILLRTMPDPETYITVGFAETMPKNASANVFYWEIAQVALTDGIASVTKQVLRHDPMLWNFTQYL